jgi:hypothetical protein
LAAVAVTPEGTEGAVVSVVVQDGVVALFERLCDETLPALSTADTLYEYVVDADRPVSDVDVAGADTCFQYDPFR